MLKRVALLLTLGFCLNLSAADSAMDSIPNPTEQDLQEVFGDRLEHGNRAASLLLLAIAFDQQSKNSPTRQEQIGIPYIATAGPGYWVRLFQQETTRSLDTVVNVALILTYAKDQNFTGDERDQAAIKLLSVAAIRDYWPAQVYWAERQLQAWQQRAIPTPMKGNEGEISDEALRTFQYLSDCARIGFAPCQFQLGFWYLQDVTTREAGIELLSAGVEVARRDPRYLSSAETMQDMLKAMSILAQESPDNPYREVLQGRSKLNEG